MFSYVVLHRYNVMTMNIYEYNHNMPIWNKNMKKMILAVMNVIFVNMQTRLANNLKTSVEFD